MATEPCPQCGYHDMSVPHDAKCAVCGTPMIATTDDFTDHLCPPHKEAQQLVDAALANALDEYDRAMVAIPREGIGGDAGLARFHLERAMRRMERLSDAVKAHETYAYWHGEVMEQLAQLPTESEGE